jgi:hypothetical protein
MGYDHTRYCRKIAGGHNFMAGTTASDDLSIFANSATDKAKIKLEGGGGVTFVSGSSANLLTISYGAVEVIKYKHTAGGCSIHIKESTTPTAIADYGSLYTKADNELYFQTGAGTEKTVTTV